MSAPQARMHVIIFFTSLFLRNVCRMSPIRYIYRDIFSPLCCVNLQFFHTYDIDIVGNSLPALRKNVIFHFEFDPKCAYRRKFNCAVVRWCNASHIISHRSNCNEMLLIYLIRSLCKWAIRTLERVVSHQNCRTQLYHQLIISLLKMVRASHSNIIQQTVQIILIDHSNASCKLPHWKNHTKKKNRELVLDQWVFCIFWLQNSFQ